LRSRACLLYSASLDEDAKLSYPFVSVTAKNQQPQNHYTVLF